MSKMVQTTEGLVERVVIGEPSWMIRPQPTICTIYFVGPVEEGPPSLERQYHRQFKAHRLHGEWFDRHPDILAEIERLGPIMSNRSGHKGKRI